MEMALVTKTIESDSWRDDDVKREKRCAALRNFKFNIHTGIFNWKPDFYQYGKYKLVIEARDGPRDESKRKGKKIERYYALLSEMTHPNYGSNCLVIEKVPIKLEKVIEYININFLKNKFSDQSDLKIGKYKLDLNSRKIIFNNIALNLTERETNLIIFIYQKGNVSIKELQKKVWDYSNDLETHTVETHIYRLRKKIKDTFDDGKFILYDNNGYFIN